MTTLELHKAKYLITDACNRTGLAPADLVGILSAILEEAREQMCFELTGELLKAQDEAEKQRQTLAEKEENDGNNGRNRTEEGPRS